MKLLHEGNIFDYLAGGLLFLVAMTWQVIAALKKENRQLLDKLKALEKKNNGYKAKLDGVDKILSIALREEKPELKAIVKERTMLD